MTVFKNFMKLAWNYRLVTIAYFLIFAMMCLPGFLNTSKDKDLSFKPIKRDILIDNRSNSEASKIFEEYFSNNNLTFKEMTEEDKKMEVVLSTYDIALTIPEDFDQRVLNKDEDAVSFYSKTESNINYVKFDINTIIGYLRNYDLDVDKTLDMLNVEANTKMSKIDRNKFAIESMLNGSTYILMIIIMFSIGAILKSYQNPLIMRRINISSYGVPRFTMELILGEFVASITFLVLLFAMVFGLAPSTINIFVKSLLTFIVYIFAILGLTNIIVEVAPTNQALTAIVNAVSLGLAFTSGVFIPKQFTAKAALNFGKFFPVYYVAENNAIGEMNLEYFKNLAIIALMALAYYAILMVIKRERNR
ncbi:MAG: ABC transporter permease [Ezakiella sp.]|nr:ABC transporter permease [Ezakiella sp.]